MEFSSRKLADVVVASPMGQINHFALDPHRPYERAWVIGNGVWVSEDLRTNSPTWQQVVTMETIRAQYQTRLSGEPYFETHCVWVGAFLERLVHNEAWTIAGLLHDAAKDLTEAQIEQIVREESIPLPAPEDRDYVHYLHGPVGAAYIRRELGISDPRVLDAVGMHTYAGQGQGLSAPLTWLVRFADILEPNRDWSAVPWLVDGAPRLRALAYAGQLEAAALLQTGLLIDWFSATGHPVHPNMRVLYRELEEFS